MKLVETDAALQMTAVDEAMTGTSQKSLCEDTSALLSLLLLEGVQVCSTELTTDRSSKHCISSRRSLSGRHFPHRPALPPATDACASLARSTLRSLLSTAAHGSLSPPPASDSKSREHRLSSACV